jgi:hypothetical protein
MAISSTSRSVFVFWIQLIVWMAVGTVLLVLFEKSSSQYQAAVTDIAKLDGQFRAAVKDIQSLQQSAAKLDDQYRAAVTDIQSLQQSAKTASESVKKSEQVVTSFEGAFKKAIAASEMKTEAKIEQLSDIVPLGTMLPYLGKDLPAGFVWADGAATFPNADWVPAHLRAAKIPDAREFLVGGAKDESGVGRTFNGGKILVNGNGFSLGAPTLKDVGLVTVKNREGTADLHVRGLVWLGPGGKESNTENNDHVILHDVGSGKLVPQFILREFSTKAYEYPRQINGAVEISFNNPASNPRHVMCRWIIRVK